MAEDKKDMHDFEEAEDIILMGTVREEAMRSQGRLKYWQEKDMPLMPLQRH